MRWLEEELKDKMNENPELKVTQVNPLPRLAKAIEKKQSKYHSRRTFYNGRWYHSKKEAQYAEYLNAQVNTGEIKFWLSQIAFHLPGKTKYLLDFMVFMLDGTTKFIEVKGFETKLGLIKRRQCEELFGISVEVIKDGE